MSDPSLTKELRTVLKATLGEKLESLGIKSGVRGIPSDHLNRALASLETAREERKKQLPDIQHIREQLVRQVNFRVAERLSCSRSLSNRHLSLEAKHRTTRLGTSLSSVFPRPIKRSSSTKRPVTQRTLTDENTSTSKTKKKMLKDNISRKPPSTVPLDIPEEQLLAAPDSIFNMKKADQKKKSQTYKLQEEINQLKEQLQVTRSQLEAERHAHMVKLSKEYEDHRSKQEEIRQSFYKWKEEEIGPEIFTVTKMLEDVSIFPLQ
ncbi:cilium assembly protein DZIP1-like [Erythrolamprus reginae]|uniref:cilium assembly protein DZIP1-like n=1 Tax=Erythrolamprus reginae TaxID=121349 RepID=UPI00396C94D2